ncbi:MAG TPA: nucleotidyltransferase domain-containing protein [Flavisolibacter sp.]|nr:nucleotidyltransferase domain-containing protein [Flavisolibacter sp.]
MGIKHDILAALSYFDLFEYPLTQAEIFQNLPRAYSYQEMSEGLAQLTGENWVYKFDELYSLQNDYARISRRLQANSQARVLLKKAEKIAGFLSAFPFVRGVAVSGSLSKNFADKDSDIDFFIITVANRLWIARTFMHLFKKLTFITRQQDLFCMNYFIDEEQLLIRENNIYTATEVVTLLPYRGVEVFERFFAANKWSRAYLPNHSLRISYVKPAAAPLIKNLFEFFLNNAAGRAIDYLLMRYTNYRWMKKTRKEKRNKKSIVLALDAGRHYAKPAPQGFHDLFLASYEKKIASLFHRYEGRVKSNY